MEAAPQDLPRPDGQPQQLLTSAAGTSSSVDGLLLPDVPDDSEDYFYIPEEYIVNATNHRGAFRKDLEPYELAEISVMAVCFGVSAFLTALVWKKARKNFVPSHILTVGEVENFPMYLSFVLAFHACCNLLDFFIHYDFFFIRALNWRTIHQDVSYFVEYMRLSKEFSLTALGFVAADPYLLVYKLRSYFKWTGGSAGYKVDGGSCKRVVLMTVLVVVTFVPPSLTLRHSVAHGLPILWEFDLSILQVIVSSILVMGIYQLYKPGTKPFHSGIRLDKSGVAAIKTALALQILNCLNDLYTVVLVPFLYHHDNAVFFRSARVSNALLNGIFSMLYPACYLHIWNRYDREVRQFFPKIDQYRSPGMLAMRDQASLFVGEGTLPREGSAVDLVNFEEALGRR